MTAAPPEHSDPTLLLTEDRTGELVSRRWRVVVSEGPDRGMELARDAGTIMVGSHPANDLALTDGTVSRYHVELRLLAEGVLVTDLDTTNGTRVAGVRVHTALVQPGGAVTVGKTVLRMVADDAPAEVAADGLESFGEFITCAPSVRRVLAQLQRVAATEATILIQGDTGTGKELIAQAIHEQSSRAAGPLVVVDCAAVSPTLLESELFGHVRGAFTGASSDRVGAFESADTGTVFLDELAELPLELQAKLLRVLEARTVRRVGESHERSIDVRFLAATHGDLDAMVNGGQFRRDLFYRVAVVRVRIPRLAERPEDIAPLAQSFVRRFGTARLSDAALHALEQYDWPGNVRELRNVIERAVAMAGDQEVIGPDAVLPSNGEVDDFHAAKEQVVQRFEERYVRMLLERHDNNVSRAARAAGLSRNSFYALMKRVGLSREE